MGVNAEAGLVISRAASIGALEREQVGLTLKGDLSVEDEKETSHPTWRSRSLWRERTVVLAFERHLAQKRRGAREGSVGWACRAIPMHLSRLPFRGMPSPRVDLACISFINFPPRQTAKAEHDTRAAPCWPLRFLDLLGSSKTRLHQPRDFVWARHGATEGPRSPKVLNEERSQAGVSPGQRSALRRVTGVGAWGSVGDGSREPWTPGASAGPKDLASTASTPLPWGASSQSGSALIGARSLPNCRDSSDAAVVSMMKSRSGERAPGGARRRSSPPASARCNCGWLRLCSCRPTRVMACQGWDDARGPSRLGDAHMTCAGRKLGEQNGQLASELRLLRILLHMQVHFAVSGAQNSRCTAACNGAKGQRGEPAQANYIAISTGLFTPRTRPTTGRQDKEPALHGASRIGFLGLTRPVPPAATVERP
ncbi:hypothetical protein Purlil1_7751 [Purpureocillium lilacinum]|uniref:Uncharacterized protein n=1 Tax=Purpureocillium lilacinum TaxID=33203 RepID=A0ABR0BX47_PURLI|nr:hypothetical protein Purlil1_7751 [Purpureocillium lilacinum]